MPSKPPTVSARASGRPQDERLADLAELMLSIAREINFQADPEGGPEARLTATEIHVMRHLGRHPGAMPKDAARGVGLQRSNFSVALRGLRDKGLVAAEPDPADGRSMRLFTTALADRNLAAHRRRWAALLAGARWDPAELDGCREVLARLEAVLAANRKAPAEEP
jgi:DNA-binding MarR family transcriptional regulator